MIDFDTLVIKTCMDVFAMPITVAPVRSQPGQPAYLARGVWAMKPVDIVDQNGGVVSSSQSTLGIRASEFQIAPVKGDRVTVDGAVYLIDDVDDDGQGGSTWTLKQVTV